MSGGTERIGQYELRGILGRGATATVYRAYDPHSDREVALKLLTTKEGLTPAVRERFRREAQTVGGLRHPHVITLHSYGEEQGRPYLVTEIFPDGPLARLLGRPLPLQEVSSIARQIGAALDYAHAQGLVHRDVKPANIFLDGPRAVLADFGLVKIVAGDGPQLTQTGIGMGTPEYIAPEHALGQRVDGRADLYALGVVLFEMLTGAPPYVGSPMEVLSQHINGQPPDARQRNPALAPGVAAVLRKALARHPQDRYASGTALADALDAAIAGGRTTAPGQLPGTPDRRARTLLVNRVPERLSETQFSAATPALDGIQTQIIGPGDRQGEQLAATQLPPLPQLSAPTGAAPPGSPAAPLTAQPASPAISSGNTPQPAHFTPPPPGRNAAASPPQSPPYSGTPPGGSAAPPAGGRASNWPLLAGLAAAAVLLLAIVGAGAVYQLRRGGEATATPAATNTPPPVAGVTPAVGTAAPAAPSVTTAAAIAVTPRAAASATAAADPARDTIAAGDLALREGRFSDAKARYAQALAINPNSAAANRQYGHMLWVWNHDAGEVDYLDRATKLAPDDALAWAYLAYSAIDTHQADRAYAAAQQAVRVNPNLAEAYAALADCYISYPPDGTNPDSGVREASDAIARAKALDPDNLWVHWFESQVLQVQEQYDAALAPLDRMITQRPNWPTLYYGKGTIYTQLKRYADARALQERALAIDPDYPYALTELGWLDYLDGDYQRAKDAFEHALRLTDDVNEYAHRGLAFTLSALGDQDGALLRCQRAVQIEARRPWGYDCLGYVYFAGLKRYDDAVTAYNTVIALRPYLEDGYIGLARTAAAQNDYRQAAVILTEGLPKIKKPVYAYYWLGYMQYQLQRYEEARANLELATQKAPEDRFAFYWLGSALERLQRWPEARAAYERALAIAPDYQDAADALDRLKRQGH